MTQGHCVKVVLAAQHKLPVGINGLDLMASTGKYGRAHFRLPRCLFLGRPIISTESRTIECRVWYEQSGAISIARRLQDPLSELVKVDPKSIDVGQYQHDVDQRRLLQSLESTIKSCVNRVGVDFNTSSRTLLRYVAGVHERIAINIVKYRDEKGRFQSRVQLKDVPGIGPKTFEQAAGFLRIRNADNPLDATAVHPESYHVVERSAQSLNLPINELIKNPQLLEKLDRSQLAAGTYTLNDIIEELRKPGRASRDKFVAPSFNEQVREISDVQPGMVLEGVVTNVTKFGAFVDLGVHQDGLVHISELSGRYVKDPSVR